MPSKKKTDNPTQELEVISIEYHRISAWLVGVTPLIYNAMSAKAKREILYPRGGRMTASQKAQSVKHNPLAEYQDSVYRAASYDTESPTRLVLPCTVFKAAICSAALDMPTNVSKAKLSRLTYVRGEYTPIWGVPTLHMAGVRSADQNKTPDVRTRATLPRWATRIEVEYASPMLTNFAVSSLMAVAGKICGVGDWRQQKGSGNFGLFRIADPDDPELQEIMESGGKAAQDAALADPVFYDQESEELFRWWEGEFERRGPDRGKNGPLKDLPQAAE